MVLWSVLHAFDILLWLFVAGSVFYVVFFSIIPIFFHNRHQNANDINAVDGTLRRFLILFPAYHEDAVIVNSVTTFLCQDYPKEHYQITVISDHMEETTNQRLSELPITLLNPVFEKSSKAKAMQYAIQQTEKPFDNVVVMDADNIVRSDFLSRLNILCAQYDAIQCHRCAKNANNDVAVLDGVSEEINNTIFRQAHNLVGLSSALIGSGMCFDYDLFRRNVFQLSTAGEDRELEALLLCQGVFIKYAAEIPVFDEKVSNHDNFQRQRMRWMTAQMQSLSRQLPKIPKAFLHGNINFIDKTIQQALIPRSILLVFLSVMSLLTTITAPVHSIKWWGLLLLLGGSLFIAIPSELRSRALIGKTVAIPGLVLRMLTNLLHMDKNNTDFIHTEHITE